MSYVSVVAYSLNSSRRELHPPNLNRCSDQSRVEADFAAPKSSSLMSVFAVEGVARVLWVVLQPWWHAHSERSAPSRGAPLSSRNGKVYSSSIWPCSSLLQTKVLSWLMPSLRAVCPFQPECSKMNPVFAVDFTLTSRFHHSFGC